MRSLQYHETKQRGSKEFPLDYHYIDNHNARYEMPYHWHEETEILYVRSGSFSLSLDGESMELAAGEAVYMAAGSLHAGTPHNCVYECIVFDLHMLLNAPGLCREKMSDIVSRKLQLQKHYRTTDAIVLSILRPMFDSLQGHLPGQELTTFGLLYAFFGAIISRGAYLAEWLPRDEGGRMLQLKAVFDLMESRYGQKLTLNHLASAAHMERKYFCRFFKQATHMTPMQYLQYYRVERACYEMQVTEKNVTEIALDVGFSSPEYFARVFRRHKTATPGEYRARMRGKQPTEQRIASEEQKSGKL